MITSKPRKQPVPARRRRRSDEPPKRTPGFPLRAPRRAPRRGPA